MKIPDRLILPAILIVALVLPGRGYPQEAQSREVREIIEKIDQLYRAASSYSEIEMEIVTPQWQRTLAMVGWSEGTEKTFIRITSPAKEKGVATLRIENEMWNYLPKTNKVIKIPPSMMMSSWMGSDFTNDDLVKEFSLITDYTYELIKGDDTTGQTTYVSCVPRPDLPVVWGKIVIAATTDSYIPISQKYYDEQGNLMRVLEYSDVRDFDGRRIPAVMSMVPQNKEGHKTVIRYNKLMFDVKVDQGVFSLRNLHSNE